MIIKKVIGGFLCLALLLPLTLLLFGANDDLVFSFQKKKEKDWIEGPVGYIITSKERKQYKKLKTEEEKARFIKWFWARRDPNPETLRNEFQNEFNSRVEYANTNFKESRFEGWETARGHVYIVLGPPSREWIENLSIGTRPAIFWLYDNPPSRYLNVMEALVFADIYRNGRYYLLRPMPMDYFEYRWQMSKRRSYFELVPDEYLRAFNDVNEKAIQKADLKLEDVGEKDTAADISAPGELSLQWKIDFVPAAEEKIELNVTITMQYKDISYYQKDTRYYADLSLSVKLFKEPEQPAAEFKDEINIELTEDELVAKASENLEYKGSLVADPGEYNIEIILEDMKTHISKTITEKLTVAIETQ